MLTISNEMYNLLEKKVLFIAKKYSNGYNNEDLMQAGMLGIMKAKEKYDENLGVQFSTFCELYIKGEILDYIRRDKNIRVSRDFIKLKKKIDIAKEHFYDKNKTMPTIDELSYILGESKQRILEIVNFDQNIKSIDESINNEESDLLLKDVIYKKDDIEPIDLICLKDALDDLDNDERKLIENRYYYGKTQTEVAKELNISQVKAYRLERKILDELESKLAS